MVDATHPASQRDGPVPCTAGCHPNLLRGCLAPVIQSHQTPPSPPSLSLPSLLLPPAPRPAHTHRYCASAAKSPATVIFEVAEDPAEPDPVVSMQSVRHQLRHSCCNSCGPHSSVRFGATSLLSTCLSLCVRALSLRLCYLSVLCSLSVYSLSLSLFLFFFFARALFSPPIHPARLRVGCSAAAEL